MSRYTVYVAPTTWKDIKDLPGHVRQGIRRAVGALAENPRPPKSKRLEVTGITNEVRRLRLDRWRVIYAVTEGDKLVDVLAVRKRPPYDYGDLDTLLEDYPTS